MNWLDRAIGAVSPQTALRRAVARERLNNYRLSSDSTLRHIAVDRGGANTISERSQAKLRDWGRHLARNNPTVTAICRELALRTSHFVIVPQVRLKNGELAEDVNAAIEKHWSDYRDQLELSGAMTYRQLRQLLGHSYCRDGEVYLQTVLGSGRFRYRTDVPLALQGLESDYLPIHLTQDKPPIVQGVELSASGQIVAYHIYKQHPSDAAAYRFVLGTDTIRIPAANMLSLLHCERLGQVRGISMLAPSGETAADIDEYMESERIAMKLASTIGLQITRPADMATPLLNADGQRTIDFEPGMVLDSLGPGEKAEMLAHDRPGSQFDTWLKQNYRAMSAGVGVNYSSVTNDFDGSYSSQRQMLVTAQAWYEHQQQIQCQRIDKPLHNLFLQALALAGLMPRLNNVDLNTLADADYVAPAMPWIDPAKEAQADQISVASGFESRINVIRKRGGSVSRIDREIQADEFEQPTQQPQDVSRREA